MCTIFLSATRSMMPCDICRVFAAAALSPAMIAFFTFLTAVRSVDLIVALRLRVTSDCLARFRACAELAMELSVPQLRSSIDAVSERPRIIRDFVCSSNVVVALKYRRPTVHNHP